MLAFFRKIRRSLLESGSAQKYLLYAIGEILLVVIGILIALQINNWDQHRIDRNREKEIVALIYSELNENFDYINGWLDGCHSRVEMGKQLIKILGTNAIAISDDTLIAYNRSIFGFASFAPETMNFNRIKNSEEINLIKYDSLNYWFGTYDRLLDRATEIHGDLRTPLRSMKIIDNQIVTFEFYKFTGEFYDQEGFDDVKDKQFESDTKSILSSVQYGAMVGQQLNSIHFFRNRLRSITKCIEEMKSFIERKYDL